jgi:ankyrin repeat protein
VATLLLDADAEPDALAAMYGGRYATMSMLVSSAPPARAGVQVPLIELLVARGASVEPLGSAQWGSPLGTALVFGFSSAAETLVRLGAKVDNVANAAGLGRCKDVELLLPAADAASRHRALANAAQLGHANVVRRLLDAGEDPDRYNPDGHHAHSTPLHQAALAGHDDVVRLLVERGARLDLEDTLWHGTPLDWAVRAGKTDTAAYLRSAVAQAPSR